MLNELITLNFFIFSAYCGGLWLAALRTMSEIAKVLGYPEDIKKYNNILQRGKRAYERKLWNGKRINSFSHYIRTASKTIRGREIVWIFAAR